MKLIIQAGHINIQFNSDTALRSGTGAPGEQKFTLRIANRLSEILRSKGFFVKQTDANANDDVAITKVDWDLFLAIHFEANVHGTGGGFLTAPDPSVDASNAESKRIAQALKDEYFKNTGIAEHEEWITPAMTLYYMWATLSAKTPCVIIECGVGQDPHDSIILADTERVCNAIARGVCKAFGINFDQSTPTPPITDWKKKYDEQAVITQKLQDDLKTANNKIIKAREALS